MVVGSQRHSGGADRSAAALAYFWGTNWLLDKFSNPIARQDRWKPTGAARHPAWLFLFPALLFLAIYLVYPVFETVRLSLSIPTAPGSWGFQLLVGVRRWPVPPVALNNFLWLLIVPALSTAFGLVIAVLADRVWWGNIAVAGLHAHGDLLVGR